MILCQYTYVFFLLNLVEIIKQFENCKLWSYQYYVEFHNISIDNVIRFCKSQSGCTNYNPQTQQYLILFNKSIDNYDVEGRQNFTLGHELGHVKLNHLLNQFNSIYEKEADYFAITFLAPLPLFKIFNIKSPINVQNIFGLSVTASGYRFKDFLKWNEFYVKKYWENDIINLFK